ncbi:MAG: hypothetical protein ABFD90_09175 [Phycisphaerales bacterium]
MVGTGEPTSPWGSFLFPHIFRSFRMAIQPSRLVTAFAAVAGICLAGWVMDLSRTVIVTDGPAVAGYGQLLPSGMTELDLYAISETRLQELVESPPADSSRVGLFAALCRFCAIQCRSGNVFGCLRAPVWALTYHTVYSVVFFAVVLVALSFAGGTICRMTALEFALGRRMGLSEAWRFSIDRIASLVAAPIGPLVIALLLGLPVVAIGALGNIPVVGELLTGLLFPLALVAGPFIAILLIGVVAGVSLMAPTIAYEDSDFFDAISRAFSNIYARPWRMGFYSLVAAVYGAACYLFVRLFAFLALWSTRGFLQLGLRDEKLDAIWSPPSLAGLLGAAASPDGWSLWLAAFFIRIWVLVVVGLTVSFILSFYFSASTIIYALMRNRVDGTVMNEVYVAAEEAPQTSE